MAKRFYLHFTIRDQRDPLVFEVRTADSERLSANLATGEEHRQVVRFFWFDCLDGRSVAVNLADIQAVRFLWDVAEAPGDLVRHEGELEIKLRGREELLTAFPDAYEQVLAMFEALDMGYSEYVQFVDEDGELATVKSTEIVWLTYPVHLLAEARAED